MAKTTVVYHLKRSQQLLDSIVSCFNFFLKTMKKDAVAYLQKQSEWNDQSIQM